MGPGTVATHLLMLISELNVRSNQLIDLPSKMASLTNLILLDLSDNPWDAKNYTQDDIPALLTFLKGKFSISSLFVSIGGNYF